MANNDSSWPRKFPIYRTLGLILAILWALATFRFWWELESPLERFHFWQYAKVSLLSEHPLILGKSFTYAFEEPDGRLQINEVKMLPADYRETVRVYKYDGKTFYQVIKTPLILSGAFLVLLVGLGVFLDRQRADRASPLRGPKMSSRWKIWRRKNKRDLAIEIEGTPSRVVIPAGKLAQHIQVVGDTGVGKSTVIRQIIRHIRNIGDGAFIYDPFGDYIEEFWQPGDTVFNPLDHRTVRLALEDIGNYPAMADVTAEGIWPDGSDDKQFFVKHPREMFAYLITRYSGKKTNYDPRRMASCENVAKWLRRPKAHLPTLLEGTQYEGSRSRNSDQSQGLDTVLGEAVKFLEMMPRLSEGRQPWTVRDAIRKHKGKFVFITCTPETLTTLRPIYTCILEQAIVELQSETALPWEPRTWLILDELADLKRVPSLASALTKNRHAGNPVVLGYHGKGILNSIYGKDYLDTALSQVYTTIVLRTREPHAAEYQSELIGKAQYERVQETRPAGLFAWKKRSYTTERPTESLVLASEISCLEDLEGYFVQPKNIVPITLKILPKSTRALKFIPREIPESEIDNTPEVPEKPEDTPSIVALNVF